MSPASRRAWPRSWVAITIFTPARGDARRRCPPPPWWRRDRGWRSARRGRAPRDRGPARGRAPGAAARRRRAGAPAGRPAPRARRGRADGRRSPRPRVRPAALSAKATLLAAVRRSITGFWKTMARRPREASLAPGEEDAARRRRARGPWPASAASSCPSRWGPSARWAARPRSQSVTSRRIDDVARRKCDMSRNGSEGWSVGRAWGYPAWRSDQPRTAHASALIDQDHADQHEAEPDGERQIALRCLERDGRRHHAREAVDVAADDHDRANLGRRPAEAGEQDGDEGEARIPEQRRDARRRGRRPWPSALPCTPPTGPR